MEEVESSHTASMEDAPTAEVALAHLDEAATALQREGRFLEGEDALVAITTLQQKPRARRARHLHHQHLSAWSGGSY